MESLQKKLSGIVDSLPSLGPELVVASGLLIILILDLIFKKSAHLKGLVVTLFGTMAILLLVNQDTETAMHFNQFWKIGDLQVFMKTLLLLSMVIISFMNFSAGRNLIHKGEYHLMVMAIALGGMFLISANHFLLFYVALELISIPSYILTTFTEEKKGYEAGMKYLLFGAMSTGIMLYGVSLLYGFTGTLLIHSLDITSSGLFLPAGLFLLGLLFKLSAFPLHIWAPATYEGAPTNVAAYFSVAPKIAVVAFLIRLFNETNYTPDDTWTLLISIIAIVTIIIGNFSALWQQNAKRMLAYSSIAHSGFLLLGLVINNELAVKAVSFYVTIYLFMNLGAFYLIRLFEKKGIMSISDMKGKGKQFTFLAVLMVTAMIALTGLPPTAGFTAKLLVFTSFYGLFESTKNSIYLIILMVAVLNTAISLFYYLKIPYFMFFKENEGGPTNTQTIRKGEILLATFLILPLLTGFIRSDLLMDLINMIKLY